MFNISVPYLIVGMVESILPKNEPSVEEKDGSFTESGIQVSLDMTLYWHPSDLNIDTVKMQSKLEFIVCGNREAKVFCAYKPNADGINISFEPEDFENIVNVNDELKALGAETSRVHVQYRMHNILYDRVREFYESMRTDLAKKVLSMELQENQISDFFQQERLDSKTQLSKLWEHVRVTYKKVDQSTLPYILIKTEGDYK